MEVAPWDGLPAQLSWKEKIAYLAVGMRDALPEVPEFPIDHTFGNGMYIRKMRIPAGTIFLGREHLKGHEVALMKGSAILITPQGKKRYDAHASLLTSRGFHTVAYCITDVEAWTYHANPDNLTNTDALEVQIFGPASEMFELGLLVRDKLRLVAA